MRKDGQTKRGPISEDETATIIVRPKIGMHSAETGRLIYRDRKASHAAWCRTALTTDIFHEMICGDDW